MDRKPEIDFMKLSFQAGPGYRPHSEDHVLHHRYPERTEEEKKSKLAIDDIPEIRGIAWATGSIHFDNRATLIRQEASRAIFPEGVISDEITYTLRARDLGLNAAVLMGSLFEHARVGPQIGDQVCHVG